MTPAPPPSAQADALIARYHAAQAALDAHFAASNDGVAGQSLPTAQARANILAHAAQLAQERGAVPVTPDAIYSGAAYAYGTRANGQFGSKNEAVNDSQWKIRALASVAILGLTGLLLTQWDRATPQEKEVAFGMERPAPAAPDAAPPAAAAAPPAPAAPAPAAAVPEVAAPTAPADTAARPIPAAPPARIPSPKAGPARLPQAINEAARSTVVAESAPQVLAAPVPAPVAPVAAAPAPATAPPPEPAIAAAPVAAAEMGVTAPPVATAGAAARARAPTAMPNAASAEKAAGVAPSAAAQASRDAAPARLMSPNMALFAAIREADASSLQLALTRGADKNAQSNGTPAIALCVQANRLALVRLLAAAGADLNAADAQGLSPLAHAQAKGLDEMVQLLLELGAK